jgi:hypothetical protein
MKATPTTAAPLKLSDMGTSGLLQWIAAGEDRLTDSKRPGIRAAKTVRRLRQPGAAILCQAMIGEAYHSECSIADLCRMAGRPHHYADAIDQARENVANPGLSDHARRTAADFLAAIAR